MSGSLQAILRSLLVNEYGSIRTRLARQFGSLDFASEVMHELYLRLEVADKAVSLRNPMAYLFRMAFNIAADRRRAEIRANRPLTGIEIDALMAQDNDLLDLSRIAEAREDIEFLSQALEELTPRQRDILLAVRLEKTSHRVLAKRFDISERTVERELKFALEYCRKRTGPVRRETRPQSHQTADDRTWSVVEPQEGNGK